MKPVYRQNEWTALIVLECRVDGDSLGAAVYGVAIGGFWGEALGRNYAKITSCSRWNIKGFHLVSDSKGIIEI
jgi:hypothetical protein